MTFDLTINTQNILSEIVTEDNSVSFEVAIGNLLKGQGYTEKGEWDELTHYMPYDVVHYLNSVYVCLVENEGSLPTNVNTDWEMWLDSTEFLNKSEAQVITGIKEFQNGLKVGGHEEIGTFSLNEEDLTIDLSMKDGVMLQLGQEFLVPIRNGENDILNNGEIVYTETTIGNSSRLVVKRFLGNGDTGMTTIGMITHDIESGEDGYATILGKVRGIDTSMWNDGDLLYPHPTTAGALTNVLPIAPKPKTIIGRVIKAHTNGTIFIRPINAMNLLNASDVLVYNPTTLTENSILLWDATNKRWVAKTSISELTTTSKTIVGAINEVNAGKFDKTQIKQVLGTSITDVMSQKATTDAINSLNVTASIPLGSGYYTLTTAIAAVPTALRKVGFEVTFESSAGIWETYQFKGVIGDWSVLGSWSNDLRESKKFTNRVVVDGGIVASPKFVEDVFDAHRDLLPYWKLGLIPHCGVKTDTTLGSTSISKLYDLSPNNNDAIQATKANQPYLGGFIALNEKYSIKRLTKDATIKNLTNTTISFLSSDSWSLVMSFNRGEYGNIIIGSHVDDYLDFQSGYIYIYTNIGGVRVIIFRLNYNWKFNVNYTLIISYNNGNWYASIDGNPCIITIGLSSPYNFSKIYTNQYSKTLTINYFSVFNKALEAKEIKDLTTFLTNSFPEIETIPVGYQQITTSNFEGIINAIGDIIPEVQDNATWANSTTIYNNTVGTEYEKCKAAAMWCYYNNDIKNGAIYGKLYNWYAVYMINAYPPAGWRVLSNADFTQLSNQLGENAVAGGKMKLQGLTYWGSPNSGATNESGFTAIGGGYRINLGTFFTLKSLSILSTIDNSYLTYYNKLLSSNISNLEVAVYQDANAAMKESGVSIRLMKNSPYGNTNTELTTGYFTTNIAIGTANKDLTIPFGYRVVSVRVNSISNLTNFKCDLYSTAGVLQDALLVSKSVTANTPQSFIVTADQKVQNTNPFLRFNATGNTGMEIFVQLEKTIL